jgi:hypothetical protein
MCVISLCTRGALGSAARGGSTAALGGTGNPMRKVFYLWLLGCTSSWAADPSDLDFVVASSLPHELYEYLQASTGHEPYVLASWLNPYYVQADFNGDNLPDIAVLVREKATDKGGILIVHVGANEHFVVGAGNSFDNGRDDFSWMDAWHTYARGVVLQGAAEHVEPPSLLGDAILVMKTEASSGLVYWTGTEYAWYQQGD